MPQVKALNQIEYRDDKGKIAVIKPNAEFDESLLSKATMLSLRNIGAVIDVKRETVVAPEQPKTESADNDKPLDKMNKAELVAVANGLEIADADDMTKAQLVEAIEAARADTGLLD